MNWTPLSTLGERAYHSLATAKRRVELNQRIGQLLQQREAHDVHLSVTGQGIASRVDRR